MAEATAAAAEPTMVVHEDPVDHNAISASTVRGGLLELETKASQLLQTMEDMRVTDTVAEGRPLVNDNVDIANIRAEKKGAQEILAELEHLICYSDTAAAEENGGQPEYLLPPLDDVSQLALISHSIVAYMNHLRRSHLSRVTARIVADTNRWLSQIFRFLDCAVSYHNDQTESVLRALRLCLLHHCPGFLEQGIQVARHVCLYVSEESGIMSLQFACRQLGLPLDNIRVVPMSDNTMDISVLQSLIAKDVAENRLPLLVLGSIGASLTGNVDNVMRQYDVCKAKGVWLHLRGHGLAALATAQGTGDAGAICDSMSLNIGNWLGIPSLPVVLLHRQLQNVALSVLESDPVVSRRLSSLSVWSTLQAMGKDMISERIIMAFESCRIVNEIVTKCDGIRVLSKSPNGMSTLRNSVVDLIQQPLNPTLLFDTALSVVVFQFDATVVQADKSAPSEAGVGAETEKEVTTTKPAAGSASADRMNVWLGEILQRDCPGVEMDIVEHRQHGAVIRFCPFELAMGSGAPTIEHLQHFAECLHAQVEILVATEHHKMTFHKILATHNELRLVELPDWAGLGGVRFVPEGWVDLLSDQAIAELNKVNSDLVEHLRATDSAFALGEGADGMLCVKFGMVTAETDVSELLDLVTTVGHEVQENSRVLDSMSEIVKKGIETVTADLQRETEEKLWQEGILRHVPVFGRVVNWWSPVSKEAGIKGRSLNLTQGVVESTENIYRYHMQMSGNAQPGNKSPPAPMVVQSVSPNNSVSGGGHSRNVSQSSAQSQQAVAQPAAAAAPPTPLLLAAQQPSTDVKQ